MGHGSESGESAHPRMLAANVWTQWMHLRQSETATQLLRLSKGFLPVDEEPVMKLPQQLHVVSGSSASAVLVIPHKAAPYYPEATDFTIRVLTPNKTDVEQVMRAGRPYINGEFWKESLVNGAHPVVFEEAEGKPRVMCDLVTNRTVMHDTVSGEAYEAKETMRAEARYVGSVALSYLLVLPGDMRERALQSEVIAQDVWRKRTDDIQAMMREWYIQRRSMVGEYLKDLEEIAAD